MLYFKELNLKEKSKIEVIRDIPEITELSLPSILVGKYLITPKAKTIRPSARPPIEEIIHLLKKLYVFNQESYSDGIYSFARKGRLKNNNDLFYAYIENEINELIANTHVIDELQDVFELCVKQWKTSIEKYRDTYFFRYYILHGDLHLGNIVRYKNELKLIDWEYFRSGPKEMEISFYLCWQHLNGGDVFSDISFFYDELMHCRYENLISDQETERIIEMLIPMWILICICCISSGKLLLKEERIRMCNSWGKKYLDSLLIH